MRQGWPRAARGQAIGLLGGSFDPAHEGHVHVTREMLKRLRLDAVWWLVSPGNPLKPRGPAPLADRLARARRVMDHPRVTLSDVEARMGTRFTAATLAGLRRHYPGVRFVWLMGADNLAQFHRWDRWRAILRMVPVAVAARPGHGARALSAPAARAFRVAQTSHRGLARARAPAWAFVALPMVKASSSAIRARGEWRG
ncbi:MAG TPA: nicotinate-nucleotide adenylyltransferase [Paracoccaceae bacterium]|nr:nicotinate-nucleotide adenylyltransferase [Paracoccaceae bacterium]